MIASAGVLAGALCMMLPSCDDGYEWAQEKPVWLGQSIYDELARRGNFSIYLKMVDDLGRKDFLSQTGSVTVFVADDDTYRAYFQAHGIDENHLSMPMKRYLVNSSMLENAYVLDLLTNQPLQEGILKGQVMRRTNTQWTAYDSIPAIGPEEFPEASVSGDYWSQLREEGKPLYNIVDRGTMPMVHFIWRQMMTKDITKSDFSYLFNGAEFHEEDVYINNVKVREGNVTCQNGYIHIMDGVPAPLPNMAAYLRTNPDTKIFSKLIDRYSAPSRDRNREVGYAELQERYAGQNLYPALAGGDEVYNRRYFFSSADGSSWTNFNGTEVRGTLKFDPSQNDYQEGSVNTGEATASNSVNTDMAAIFAPTDEALREYWNSEGGAFLRERYPSEEPFENVPNEVLSEFLNNHMQYSFLSSLPSKFNLVLDDAKDPVGMEPSDIVLGSTAVCNNGAVYVMNKAYAPASFRSVIAPTLVNENMRIMNWAINNLEFEPYLLSMVSHYDFIILTDEALSCYVDPVSYGGSDPRWFEFYYNVEKNQVEARSYRYDKNVGGREGCTHNGLQLLQATAVSDGSGGVTYSPNPVVQDRLEDLLNFCIVPRDIAGGNYVRDGITYYYTKDDGVLQIRMVGEQAVLTDQFSGHEVTANDVVEMDNGKYYVVDEMLQPTFRTLMDELDDNLYPGYSEFNKLLLGADDGLWDENQGLDEDGITIGSFSSYHYTLYIPDNAAMQAAYDRGLPTWDDIENLDNVYANDPDVDVDSLKTAYSQRLLNFLKYHIQDQAVYIGGEPREGEPCETAAMHLDGPEEGLSYRLTVTSDASGITVRDNSDWSQDATVAAGEGNAGNYNRLVREYTLTGKTANDNINTSSYVVVHRIHQALVYDDECFCLKDNERVQKQPIMP